MEKVMEIWNWASSNSLVILGVLGSVAVLYQKIPGEQPGERIYLKLYNFAKKLLPGAKK